MAILTGALIYNGSFKSIRNYRKLHDPKTYAGEKGGANRDLIMKNPAFVRTRENMSEFGGCGAAVKVIRKGFLNLIPEQVDGYFTGRLMRVTKKINLYDTEGIRGRRSIIFSACRDLLRNIVFNVRVNLSEMIQGCFRCIHPESRLTGTLSVSDLKIRSNYIPLGATHFRVQNHLSVISDWAYSDLNHRYEALSPLNGLSAFAYSSFIPIYSTLNVDLITSFPADTVLTADCTVMQCVGVDFYIRSAGDIYLPLKGGCMKVGEVF
jgi:hypothetical protein